MNSLSEIGRTLGEIADDTGNSWDTMSEQELTAMMQGLGVASFQCSCLLVERCGSELERARLQISRAMDLPPRVLHRRAKEAEGIISRGDTPNVPQIAAWIAVMLQQIQAIGARIERTQAGAAFN